MHLVVGEAERGLERLGERRLEQGPAIVPAPLVPGERPDAGPGEVVLEAEAVEDARGVRADLHTRADLAQLRRLLVDVHVEAPPKQRHRRGQPADPAPDDTDPRPLPSRHPTHETPGHAGVFREQNLATTSSGQLAVVAVLTSLYPARRQALSRCSAIHCQMCVPSMLGSLRAT